MFLKNHIHKLNTLMKKQRDHWIKTAGGVSISKKDLEKILKKKLKILN